MTYCSDTLREYDSLKIQLNRNRSLAGVALKKCMISVPLDNSLKYHKVSMMLPRQMIDASNHRSPLRKAGLEKTAYTCTVPTFHRTTLKRPDSTVRFNHVRLSFYKERLTTLDNIEPNRKCCSSILNACPGNYLTHFSQV